MVWGDSITRASDAYETVLNYTLFPSIIGLFLIMFAEILGLWTVPQVVFQVLMVHYLCGVLYSMAGQHVGRYGDA